MNNQITECLFCSPEEELVIDVLNDFLILYDPYPIQEGHLLIVSKQHFSCAGEMEESLLMDIDLIKNHLATILRKHFGGICFYEHGRAGACTPHSSHGDCHHFHLHVLGSAISIESELVSRFPGYRLDHLHEISDYYNSYGEYLFFEDNTEKKLFFPVQNQCIPSHLLRTLVSNKLGYPERADWTSYLNRNFFSRIKQKMDALLCLSPR